jgi:hypothetical protein
MINLTRSLQIFLWSFAFIYVVTCSLQITQIDLWWQLPEGLKILRTWTLPTAPAIAFGFPAPSYFDEYAGYEVVLALLFKIAGFPGLWMVFSAMFLAIIFLPVATTAQKYPSFDFFSTAALFFAGLLMKQRLEERPELVAGLLLVLLMVMLRNSRLEKITPRTLGILFFLFLAWTNTHSTFVIGLFTLGLWLACEIILKFRKLPLRLLLRQAAAAGAVALIATLLNPYGPRRLLFPFIQASDAGSTALSPEMWPVTECIPVAIAMILITALLLGWGLLTTRGLPLWLVLFSLFSVVLSLKTVRFINLLAISTLFVYAGRAGIPATKSPLPLPLGLLKDVALCLLCIFLIFGDAFGFLSAYGELRSETRLATHTTRFAPEICAIRMNDSPTRVPVLCGHGTGSYLTFGDRIGFRPLLDSGLSHFSNDTKRYFFFLLNDSEALQLVLQRLHVDAVIIDKENFAWTPTLQRLPSWEFVACTDTGMLWKRGNGAPHPLSASDRGQIETSIRQMMANGEIIGAFGYSTLLDQPADSLDLLARYDGPPWSDAFFNSLCAWVDTLPLATIRDFLARDHPRPYPLVDAILYTRLGPQAFDDWIATNPSGPRPWFWKALAVRNCLQKGDVPQARAIFDTISPVPTSSVTYYQLWHQVRTGDSLTSDQKLSAFGQWQTWDANARSFVESMSDRLNDRLAEVERLPGS